MTRRRQAARRGAEIALAAVDEGLLELTPNESLEAARGDDAAGGRKRSRRRTAQMQVIGKRHFGKKARARRRRRPAGATRELFDTLLIWQGRVAARREGRATVEVPVNDSLTTSASWRSRTAARRLFGTGDATIRTTQDLMLHPGLPPLVREDDELARRFTLRNASDRNRARGGRARHRWQAVTRRSGWRAHSVELAARRAREVGWPVAVPVNVERSAWDVGGQTRAGARCRPKPRDAEGDGGGPAAHHQATLLQVDKAQGMQVAPRPMRVPGRGGVLAHFARACGNELPGVREYMSRYPYTCLEQHVARGGAARREPVEGRHGSLPAHLDGDGLLGTFPPIRTRAAMR